MEPFAPQVSGEAMILAVLYTLCATAVILVVLGLGLIDMGLVRRRNVLDTWVQKISAAMIGGTATLLGGYAIWQWQFNEAFGVPSPFVQAVKDWWIFGAATTTPGSQLDPKLFPEADVLQVFLVFFVTFTMATMALIHTGVVERIKARPLYVMSAVIGLVLSPLAGYLLWGSLSPLTKLGVHDFDGVFPLYIFAGTWVLVLAWRVGPRLGAFTPHPSGARPVSHNLGLVGAGVLLIVFTAPFVAIGSGFIIPGKGFFGISFTSSGIGLVVMNVFASILGGGVMGTLLAYRRKEPQWALLGPIAGLVIGGTLYDVGTPGQCLAIGLVGPLVAIGTTKVMRRIGIDEPKVLPLAFGPGVVGAILTGFIAWGTPTGGYPGLTGEFGFQGATITPWWQLVGVLADMAISGIPCLILCLIFERFGGLRVSEETEVIGLDAAHWGTTNFGDDLDPPVIAVPGAEVVRTG